MGTKSGDFAAGVNAFEFTQGISKALSGSSTNYAWFLS